MTGSAPSPGSLFLQSALAAEGHGLPAAEFDAWFAGRQRAHRFKLEQIPFADLKKWSFHPESGNLVHDSGRFFSIEGLRVRTNWGKVPEWEQPIIVQPEIGILGFITKRFGGILHFLVQAKMEPGNIDMIQLAPTLQATRSNFTCVHQGRKPPYLEYFLDRSGSRVLVDVLQSEQGARFLRKRNRNIMIETDEEVPVGDDYVWMTLGQLLRLLRRDNVVNMDARTVLSCITYALDGGEPPVATTGGQFGQALWRSFQAVGRGLRSNEEVLSWFTQQKFAFDLDAGRIPLQTVRGWERTDMEIRHETGRYFSVMACAVEADNREVPSWTQPMVKAQQQGLIAFVVREFDGVLHFLVQAKVEPGNFDVVEMAPTVQCITGSYHDADPALLPPFVPYVLSAQPESILFDALQSEEGGRFFREENRNLIVAAGPDFPDDIPSNYIWMTAGQLNEFIKFNNFVNVQARSLLSTLSFAEPDRS
ncbi:MAG: NDP-hexose 2,3-dehydratase family protein [Verrucomicrobiaceae bacterium]|nr:NDP-hexose 2,3-dehydratase family protein [Verrucomicrobiaceae bacterium]